MDGHRQLTSFMSPKRAKQLSANLPGVVGCYSAPTVYKISLEMYAQNVIKYDYLKTMFMYKKNIH